MSTLTKDSLTALLAPQSSTCLSLYQGTHRHYPENQQDPIRFRNLLKQLEASLLKSYPEREASALLKPFSDLVNDKDFWNHTLDGLAVLSTRNLLRVFRLPRPVADLAVVANSFHVKPLWRFLQSVDGYQVLGLSLDKIRLFEGDRDGLEEIELSAGVPRTITDALGAELTEPHQTVSSYGGIGGASGPMRNGHGGKSDESDIDADRFFRSVDRAILAHYSQPSGLPLILAALPEHHHRFHSVSENPFLQKEGIMINPDVISNDALRALAWKVMQPRYEEQLKKMEDDFAEAREAGRGSDNLAQISEAAISGRVATLLIDADQQIAGKIEAGTGKLAGDTLDNPQVDDVLDDLGEKVGSLGGEVFVIPAARMPTKTGLAAIYRY